jgi:hypothetical protein
MAVATAAIGGLVIAGASAGMSFSQASKQRKLQAQAEQDAAAAMQEARKKLDVNFAENMSIKKEAYDLEREALLSAGAQATNAGMESERGSAATAGRIYAAQQQGQAGVRGAMADEMTNIENAIIEEDGRLRDLDVALDLEEVAGNQQKAADAQARAEAAKQQGIQSTVAAAQAGMQLVPLYSQNMSAQKAAVGGMSLDSQEFQDFGNVMGKNGGVSKSMGAAGSDGFTNLDLGAVGNMSNKQFRQFKRELSPEQQRMLFQNSQYINAYNNPFKI